MDTSGSESKEASTAVNPVSIVEGPGIKVGEGTTLFPVVGVETGVISNVFYEDTDPTAAGLLRILAQVGFGSLPEQRFTDANPPESSPLAPIQDRGAFQYRVDLYAAYDQYLSDNDRVTDQGGISGGLVLRGAINPHRPLSLSFLEHFQRVTRPTNFESSQNTDREVNAFTLRLNYQPLGRTIGGYLYYRQQLDFFEDTDQRFANRLNHALGLRVQYQWLPLTRVFVDVSQGIYGGLGASSLKGSSYPFAALAGIQTMFTLNLTLTGRVGYTHDTYSEGPGYSSATGGLQLGYRYSPLGRLLLLYSYDLQDSINANFFRDHQIQASVEQRFVPFVTFIRGELHFRTYEGITNVVPNVMTSSETRADVIARVNAGLSYSWRNWLASTLEYEFTTDQTDFMYTFNGVPDDPSYARHELLLGVKGAF